MRNWLTVRLNYLDNEFVKKSNIKQIDNDLQCPCQIYVYSLTGQLISIGQSDNASGMLLNNNLERGVYIINIQGVNSNKIHKITVKQY
jgi:hypothetical protein